MKILFLILFCYTRLSSAEPNRALTLEEIKKFGISNNFGLRAAEAEVDETKAQTVQKRSAFFPKLSVVTGPEFKTDEKTNKSNTMAYLDGKWNIFRGSQDRVKMELSRLNERIAESNKTRTQFELELDIEGLFYLYLFKNLQIKYAQDSLEINGKHKGLIKQKQSSGLASQADIMEFDLRDSQLRSQINGFEQERDEAKRGLIRLMGPSVGSNFAPFGSLPHMHLKRSIQEFLSQINSTSESVRSSSLRAAAGSLEVKAAKSSWFPTVDVETKYGKLSQDVSDQNPAFEGNVLLRWEFFSGFETSGLSAEATAKAKRLELEFQQRLLTTMTEAEVNFSKLKSIQERVHVEDGNEERSKKYYTVILAEYRKGLKNGADLKNAEGTLLDSRMRASDLTYQFIDSKIKLEKSIGLFIETEIHDLFRK